MFERLKRITLYTGNLGSGKTEVAINTALCLTETGKNTSLVDLDIINPYFRTRLVGSLLEEKGLNVISTDGKFSFADQPAISAAVKGVILNNNLTGVFDVGGDDIGTFALGQFRELFPPQDTQMLLVINCCRPFTNNPDGIAFYLKSIENASGLKVSGFVNNTNLGEETTLDTILEGQDILFKASKMLSLDILFTAVKKELTIAARNVLGGNASILSLDRYMKTPWE